MGRLSLVLLALAIFLCAPAPLLSAPAADVVGFAATTCEIFTEEYRSKPEISKVRLHDWLGGFWSGLNMERKISKTEGPKLRDFSDLKNTLSEELLIECQAKPDSPLIASIFSLIYQRK